MNVLWITIYFTCFYGEIITIKHCYPFIEVNAVHLSGDLHTFSILYDYFSSLDIQNYSVLLIDKRAKNVYILRMIIYSLVALSAI